MGLLLVLGMLTALLPIGALTPAAAVDTHLSEFHYDNDGTDTGEFVEVTGDAGTDLSGWSIVLYNGSNGTVYDTIDLTSAVIDDEGTGIGAVDFQLPSNGLQNGSPDGIALADDTGALVEFISYEGSFVASGGAADGVTSTDVLVSETGTTPVGQSLQLLGGVWVGPDEASPGLVNGTEPLPTVNISEFHYDNVGGDAGEFVEVTGDAGADLADWSIALYNGSNGLLYNTIDLTGTLIDDEGAGIGAVDFQLPANGLQNGAPDGIALVNPLGVVVEFLSYEGPMTAVDGPAAGLGSVDVMVAESSSTAIGESLQFFNGAWTGPAVASPGVVNTGPPPPPADAVITEFHYDNDGTDTGEFFEVTGTAGGDLTGWTVELYNGSNSEVYNTIALGGFIDDEGAGIGAVDFQLPANGLQNGSPDGLALVDDSGVLVEFLSYEGTITGVGGAADGVTSVDVGVEEGSSTPAGQSLQLIAGIWIGPAEATPGDVNAVPLPNVFLSELHYDNAGGDIGEFVEITGDAGADLANWSIVLYNGSNGESYATLSLLGTIDDEDGTSGAVSFPYVGIQNGAPDGVALIDSSGAVVEFLSYEGVLTATNGPASGMTSVDIGISESGSTAVGLSLQLVNGGWIGPVAESPGLLNTAPPLDATPIYTVQGSGLASSFDGQIVAVEGVVTSDQQDGDLNGFFMQDVAGDGDPATSDGIYVFEGTNDTEVSVGDVIRVQGTVDEFFDMTEITDVTLVAVIGTAPVVATSVSLPWNSLDEPEQYEGMYVTIPQSLVISEYFNFDRFGEIVLTTDRAMQPTAVFEPGSADATALAEANQLARITLDDNQTAQNPEVSRHPNGLEFTLDNLFRGGDIVENVTGVINYSFGIYRIQPTEGADYTATNPRTAAHDPVGGTLEVASFNVLNYFTTLDNSGSICGPSGDLGCRGADDAEEFERQRAKIVAAIAEINADVVGLMEIENNDAAIADLVSGLNDLMGTDTYAYVDTGPIGTDAIKVAFIYKPATVSLNGAYRILDSTVDPTFNDDKNRPALAQTFTENANGESVTVVVNHLKSKGSNCDDLGDPDLGDGAGNCNLTRTAAAVALGNWLADPANGFDDDVLIIGDLNSYDKEDPIDALIAAGYSDLVFDFLGEYAYSYVFSGQWGYLDYAMANSALRSAVTGTTVWHINADEADLIDYDTSFKSDGQDALYAPDPYRASDHDPVIVGLQLDRTAPDVTAEFDKIWAGFFSGLFEVDFSCTDASDPDPDCVGDINGIAVEDGQRVYLLKSFRGTPWSRQIGSILFIKDRSFTLTVTGTDQFGNTATTTAEPAFRTRRGWHAN
jgi:predicted extracellular nuclease